MKLVVFCQNSRLIDRYRDEIARRPDQAINYYRLAQAAEAIGRDEVALTSLESPPCPAPGRRRVSTASRSFEATPSATTSEILLMKLGQKAKASKELGPRRPSRFELGAEASPERPRPVRRPARTLRGPARPGRASRVGRDPPDRS